MSFGYGFFIEEEKLLEIRAKFLNKTVDQLLIDTYSGYGLSNLREVKDNPIRYWKTKQRLDTLSKILEGSNYININRTYSFYYDSVNNTKTDIVFIGKIFQLQDTSIRYSQFYSLLENKSETVDLNKVNEDMRNNGFDSNLCDFYILNQKGAGIIYKKEESVKL